MTAATQLSWEREAARWAELQPIPPINLRCNEIGIWFDDLKGSTHLVYWADVQAEIVDG